MAYLYAVRNMFLFLLLLPFTAPAQTIGSNSVFSFVNLAHSPQLTALGNINITQPGNDASLAFANPALLNDSMHSAFSTSFNAFFSGTLITHAMGVHHSAKLNTSFAGGIYYFNYGKTTETDAAGNILGTFRPADYVLQVAAAQSYGEEWRYGLVLKYLHSAYGQYTSSGIAADFGVTYTNVQRQWRLGFVAKNMGVQLKGFSQEKEDLPFDVQLGFSKTLRKLPLVFSVTAHHLHQFDIRYNDTTFDSNPFTGSNGGGSFTADKLFRHFIAAVQYRAGANLEFTAAYNHLRRAELKLSNAPNGLNGFSAGVGIRAGKFFLRYARSYYQHNRAYHHMGIQLFLKEYMRVI